MRNNQITDGLIFENLWTVEDCAEKLRIPKKTIYDWVYKRKIPFVKVHSMLRFRPSEIEKWLSNSKE